MLPACLFTLACFPAPIPPAPFPSGEGGGNITLFRRGLPPPAPRALNRLRHLQNLPSRYPAKGSLRFCAKMTVTLSFGQCRQPRRGGTGGDGTIRRKRRRRLRWSSPPGQGEQVPHRVQPPLRTPQRQGQPVPPEAKAHTTTIFSLPPAVAAQGKPRRRRAERREQTEQYAGEH